MKKRMNDDGHYIYIHTYVKLVDRVQKQRKMLLFGPGLWKYNMFAYRMDIDSISFLVKFKLNNFARRVYFICTEFDAGFCGRYEIKKTWSV